MRRIRLLIVVFMSILIVACGGGGSPSASNAPGSPSESIASAAGASDGANASPVSVSAKIDVGGHSLYYACFGQGSPTVVLDHGLGGDLGEWGDVFPGVSTHTRVCAYDRANVRGSDAVEGTRTVKDAVADLHALLAGAKIGPPYVLVGFSWGGLIDQLYARTYPKDVVGLVLVESNNAEEARTYWAHLTPAQVAQDKGDTAGPNPEHMDILGSFDLVRAAPSMRNVPLVVVTRTVADPDEWPAGWDAKTFNALQAGLQADLAKLTTKGKQVFAEGAGHDIPAEKPDAVIAAILHVLAAAGGS